MPVFRICAKSRQAYTQCFEVHAATPDEALDLVRQGNVEITSESFDYVEDVEPFVVQQVEREPNDEDHASPEHAPA